MKTEKNLNQKKHLKHLFSERYKENIKTRNEIYRMIYFLNKIEGPQIEDLFKKYKIQFSDSDNAELKGNYSLNATNSIQSLN